MRRVGDIIDGKYELTALIGQGAMGTVFASVHRGIGKTVAIKFLSPEHASNPKIVARFHQEARAAAAAGHPGVVDIFDMGVTEEGEPFLVMERLKGRTLAELFESLQTIDVSMAAYIGCSVLSALSATHKAGVIHRDLKPDNIFFVETGAALGDVKILDFGISRFRYSNPECLRLTDTGTVVGTPLYMSPEQACGVEIDHRTDIYSLGVILYEALTGEPPFHPDNYNAMIVMLMSEHPLPLVHACPDVPSAFAAAIERALEKDRSERFQHADEMYDELLPFVAERALDKMPPPIRSFSSGEGAMMLPLSENEDLGVTELESTPARPELHPLYSEQAEKIDVQPSDAVGDLDQVAENLRDENFPPRRELAKKTALLAIAILLITVVGILIAFKPWNRFGVESSSAHEPRATPQNAADQDVDPTDTDHRPTGNVPMVSTTGDGDSSEGRAPPLVDGGRPAAAEPPAETGVVEPSAAAESHASRDGGMRLKQPDLSRRGKRGIGDNVRGRPPPAVSANEPATESPISNPQPSEGANPPQREQGYGDYLKS